MARLIRSVTTTEPGFARRRGLAVGPDQLHVDAVAIDVQPLVPFALAGDQAHLLAAVAVGHLAGEHLLDDLPLPVVQDHGAVMIPLGRMGPRPRRRTNSANR